MSKSIRSYPKNERRDVILRRLKNNAGGLGTMSAKYAAIVSTKRYLKKNGIEFHKDEDGYSVDGKFFKSLESYFEQNYIEA